MSRADGVPIEPSVRALRAALPAEPEVLVVAGSGLDALRNVIDASFEIPFEDVPGFPAAGVRGHAGRYVYGTVRGAGLSGAAGTGSERRVLLQGGRFHHYEGYAADVVEAPVRVAAALGARTAILTNASGSLRRELVPGTIVLIDSHLDLQGRVPVGPGATQAGAMGPGIRIYDPELLAFAEETAEGLALDLPWGCYAAVLGPAYETPAEVGMLAALGADVVGMSTAPEAVAARAAGMAVLGLSVVTDLAGGDGAEVTHEEVLENARAAGPRLAAFVAEIVGRLPR